jgi:glutathione S-transferase
MTIILYELAAGDDRRFSPYCWRARLALEHKQLAYETRGARFIDIPDIADGRQTSVPVIDDDGEVVGDSWRIAEYLDTAYPGRPALIPDGAVRAFAGFLQRWMGAEVHARLVRMMVKNIHDILDPRDQPYFRRTREARLGATLEEVQAGQGEVQAQLHAALAPLEAALAEQPYLAGAAPAYPDYLVFGTLHWADCCCDCRVCPQSFEALPAWYARLADRHGAVRREAMAA